MKNISELVKTEKSVERTMAIILTATKGPDENFMKVLEEYISGKISLEDIEKRVDCLGKAISDALINFPETDILPEDSNNINEEYQIAKSDYEAFKEKYSVKK